MAISIRREGVRAEPNTRTASAPQIERVRRPVRGFFVDFLGGAWRVLQEEGRARDARGGSYTLGGSNTREY